MAMTEQDRLQDAERALADARLLGPVPPSILFTAALGRGRLRLAQHKLDDAIDDLTAVLGVGLSVRSCSIATGRPLCRWAPRSTDLPFFALHCVERRF